MNKLPRFEKELAGLNKALKQILPGHFYTLSDIAQLEEDLPDVYKPAPGQTIIDWLTLRKDLEVHIN